MICYNKIFINGLQVLGDRCPYYANLYNFLLDSSNTNNDSELYYHGSYSGSSKINSKTFTLVVSTKLDNDIKSALQLSYLVRVGDVSIVADVEGIGEIECKAKKETIVTDDFGTMTITFKMCDPCLYKKEFKELTLEKVIEGGWKIPTSAFTVPENWTYPEKVLGNIGEAVNEGYATVYPVIQIEGQGRNFNVINETTGENLNLDIFIESGDMLYIDCNPKSRSVKVNEISKIQYKSGNYISLVNGSNQIKVDYDGECVVHIRWKEAWI